MSRGYFETIWLFIWNNLIKNSLVYKGLKGFYEWIVGLWRNSLITSWFRNRFIEESPWNSGIGRIFGYPFTVLENINKKSSEKIKDLIEKSIVIKGFKYFLHNIIALNLRYIGTVLLSFGVADFIILALKGGKLVLPLAVIGAGLILSIFDVNFVDYIKPSLLSKFAENLLGTELTYSHYYLTRCSKKSRFISAVIFGFLGGVVAGTGSFIYGVLILCGIVGASLVFYKTEVGVFATAFLAPILPTMLVAGMVFLCMVSLLARSLYTRNFKWKKDGMGFLVAVMIFVFLASVLKSFGVSKSIQVFLMYMLFMAFYFVVINTVKTEKMYKDLMTVFVLSATLVSIYGFCQYLFGWNVNQAWMDEEMFEDIKMRIYSTLENPNVLGEYLLLAIPMSVGLMWTKKKWLSKIFYIGTTGILFLALILTFSRGCWIGLMVTAAAFVTFVSGKLWGLLLLALPVLPFVIPESIIKRFTSVGNMEDTSTSYRVFIWMGTFALLKDYWFGGIGMGQEAFTKIYPFYSYNGIVAPHAHNTFLQLWVETGIWGLLVFVFIMFMYFKYTAGIMKQNKKGSEIHTLSVALSSGILGFLVQSMFDNTFYNYRVFMIFWLVLAMTMSAPQTAEVKEEQDD